MADLTRQLAERDPEFMQWPGKNRAQTKDDFNPQEPRDSDGKWTAGGKTGKKKADPEHKQRVQEATEKLAKLKADRVPLKLAFDDSEVALSFARLKVNEKDAAFTEALRYKSSPEGLRALHLAHAQAIVDKDAAVAENLRLSDALMKHDDEIADAETELQAALFAGETAKKRLKLLRETPGHVASVLATVQFKCPPPEPTEKISEGIHAYVGHQFGGINSVLRKHHGKPPANSSLLQYIEGLDEAMEQCEGAPAAMIVSRGVHDDISGALSVGQTVTEDGYSSTSFSEKVANEWAPHQLRITIPKGFKFLPVPAYATMMYKTGRTGKPGNSMAEAEALLPRGTKFRVTKIEAGVVHLKAFKPSAADVAAKASLKQRKADEQSKADDDLLKELGV